jgi:hypothetical protein
MRGNKNFIMADPFLNFQKFYDKEIAADIALQLEANDIPVELEDEDGFFDISFSNNQMLKSVWLKVKSSDMIRAENTLHAYYKKKLDLVPGDYYLFDFTDAQLEEIVETPDEWGYLDYPLALQILKNRGMPVSNEKIKTISEQRIHIASNPKDSPSSYIFLGYLVSIVFWPGGLIAGGIMAFMKKTVFNGDRRYAYSARDRKHGERIVLISILFFIVWLFRMFYRRN